MNLPPAEWLLALGVAGFYLQDAALLLHYDEIVLVRRGRRWSASAGGEARLRDRYLYLPNPLTPAAPLLRSGWLDPAEPREHWAGLAHFLAAATGFGPACRLLAGLLLVALPLLLWRFPHPLAMLALAAAVYATVLAIGLRLWRFRRVLELERGQALKLAFELLCCPPHAINTVRRLCARRGLRGNALDAMRHLLDPAPARSAAAEIGQRLDMAEDFHGDRAALRQARQRLEEWR